MKIRCRECKTVYDNQEKYCPYCYARTDAKPSRIRVDGQRTVLNAQPKGSIQSQSKIKQQSTTATRSKKVRSRQTVKRQNIGQKIFSEIILPLIAIFLILSILTRLIYTWS